MARLQRSNANSPGEGVDGYLSFNDSVIVGIGSGELDRFEDRGQATVWISASGRFVDVTIYGLRSVLEEIAAE